MKRFLERRIDASSAALGVPMEYLKDILRSSTAAFGKFLFFMPLAGHRRHLPKNAYHLARLAATQHEDCGTCVQIVVRIALRDGVPEDLLRAGVAGDEAALGDELARVVRFSRAVCSHDADADEDALRARMREQYGQDGLVELALAIASARVFPVTKRALGHATACSRVDVRFS